MTFKELRQLFIGDFTFVEVYSDSDEDEHILTAYNGRDNLVDDYDDCRVTGITTCGHYGYSAAIRVELAGEEVDRVRERARYNERDRIIFGEDFNPAEYMGGIRRFGALTLRKAKDLVEKGFLDMSGQQNWSPTVDEFIDFVNRMGGDATNWLFGGYAVAPDRTDCRVTIDELICKDTMIVSPLDASAFVHFARHADDLDFYYDPDHPQDNELRAQWY